MVLPGPGSQVLKGGVGGLLLGLIFSGMCGPAGFHLVLHAL